MTEKTVRLLLTAGILLLIAGCIFGLISQWIYAALVWGGAFGCCIAALNFKNRKNKEADNENGEDDEKLGLRGPKRSVDPGMFKMI